MDELTFKLSDSQLESPAIKYAFHVVDNRQEPVNEVTGPNALPGYWNNFLRSPSADPLSNVVIPISSGRQIIPMRPQQTIVRTLDLQGGTVVSLSSGNVSANSVLGVYTVPVGNGMLTVSKTLGPSRMA